MKKRNKTESLTLTSLMIALGIILPFATAHGFGLQGNIFLPMHIPVFICGLLCGPIYGGVTGAVLPIISCLITGMPAPYPNLPLMIAELAVYGVLSGLIYTKTPLFGKKRGVYFSLVLSMIGGRICYGLLFSFLLFFDEGMKAPSVIAALVAGIPGILIHLLIVPAAVFAFERFFAKKETKKETEE